MNDGARVTTRAEREIREEEHQRNCPACTGRHAVTHHFGGRTGLSGEVPSMPCVVRSRRTPSDFILHNDRIDLPVHFVLLGVRFVDFLRPEFPPATTASNISGRSKMKSDRASERSLAPVQWMSCSSRPRRSAANWTPSSSQPQRRQIEQTRTFIPKGLVTAAWPRSSNDAKDQMQKTSSPGRRSIHSGQAK